MNYRKDMERSIQFIENHIKSPLSVEVIAHHAGYSIFHYSRLFLACYGLSVMEYVRGRRLSLAGHAIKQGEKVIDAAQGFGFETASGFSKAFRRHFGCSPREYKGEILQITSGEQSLSKDRLMKNMKIVKREEFLVAGYAYETPESDVSSTKDVAALWDVVDMEGIEGRLYRELDPPKHGEIGIFIPDEKGIPYYMLGLIVEDFSKVRKQMKTLVVPAGTYAVFTTANVDQTYNPNAFAEIIKATWEGVFIHFFDESSEFDYDFSKKDFEYYDERCHSEVDPIMEIWVPIKQKEKENA